MYMDRCVEVSKAENGFVVACTVPLKPAAKSSSKMVSCCSDNSANKQYLAKTASEAADLLEDILPLLDTDYTTEAAFDAAFKKATAESNAEEAKEKM
jgi:hypothetical protein